jgi:hypothetical protein
VFLVNSRSPRFSATPFGSKCEFLHLMGAHLLPKLRCYFAEFLNQSSLKRLGILSLPTCVGLRYGYLTVSLRGFSWQHGINHFARLAPLRHHVSALNGRADLPALPAYTLEPGHPTPGWPTLLRPPFAQTTVKQYGNINPFPITYASRPRLRGRLTLSRLT